MTDAQLLKLRSLIERRHDGATVIVESGPAGSIRSGKINRDAHLIQDTTLISAHSSNGAGGRGRKYSARALRQIAAMAEGLPAYLNHTTPDLAFKPRPVQDLIGRHVNVRYDPASGKVLSDLLLVAHHAPMVFELAERMGDQVGNSLVSKGLVRMESDGTETVDEIVQLRSGDLVSDPASTRGLWESLTEARHEGPLAEEPESLDAVMARIFCGPKLPLGLYERAAALLTGSPQVQAPSERAESDLHARLARAATR